MMMMMMMMMLFIEHIINFCVQYRTTIASSSILYMVLNSLLSLKLLTVYTRYISGTSSSFAVQLVLYQPPRYLVQYVRYTQEQYFNTYRTFEVKKNCFCTPQNTYLAIL